MKLNPNTTIQEIVDECNKHSMSCATPTVCKFKHDAGGCYFTQVNPSQYKLVKPKTYMEDFFERYPDAPKDDDGTPQMCPHNVYKQIQHKKCQYPLHEANCVECWNQECMEG